MSCSHSALIGSSSIIQIKQSRLAQPVLSWWWRWRRWRRWRWWDKNIWLRKLQAGCEDDLAWCEQGGGAGRQSDWVLGEAGELYMYNPASSLGQTQLTGIMLAWPGSGLSWDWSHNNRNNLAATLNLNSLSSAVSERQVWLVGNEGEEQVSDNNTHYLDDMI